MNGLIAWFARNPVAANLLMLVILAVGLWSTFEVVKLEVFPEFERDTVSVSFTYPGATPEEVEQSVLIRAEEAIADLPGIAEIVSTANEGRGLVRVEVDKGFEPRDLLDDIKNRIDAIDTFPEDVERPGYQVDLFRREVISVVVYGDLPELELRRLGEQVRDDLTGLPEVSQADLVGVRAFEMTVEVDPFVLEKYGLSLEEVAAAIRAHNRDLPAGSVKTGAGDIQLRSMGQVYDADKLAAIPLRSKRDGGTLRLGEIATIRDGFDEEPLAALFNGHPAALIEVYRVGNQSALEVGRQVRDYVSQAKNRLPDGVQIDYWRDRSRIVKLRLNTLLTNAVQGGILIFLTLALFLRFSIAFWVAAGIPVSFMGALLLMPVFGASLNLVTLFAFILVLGMVVDDAIVTGESIYTHLRRKGETVDSVIRGAQEVAVPVTFGLLTTAAAFLPLWFMEGRRGPIFAQIPLVVIPVLAFSWIESKLILPAHLRHVHLRRESAGPIIRLQRRVAEVLERGIEKLYRPILERCLAQRYLTFALFTVGVGLLACLPLSGRYGYTFLPRIQSEIARATLVMPPGTSAEVTRRHLERMAQAARRLQQRYMEPDGSGSVIRHMLVSVGWASGTATGVRGNPEVGRVTLEMIPPEERQLKISTRKLVAEWRREIGPIPGVKELTFRAEIGRSSDPLDIQLRGSDDEGLRQVVAQLKERLAGYQGVFDVLDSFDDGKQEIRVRLKPGAEALGLTATDLGRQLRGAFHGIEAQRLQRGRDDVAIMVRYPRAERGRLATLERMLVRTPGGQRVPLAQVAELDFTRGYSSIRRVDRHRAVDVTADIDKDRVDLNRIGEELRVYLDKVVAGHPGIRYSLEGELREQRESLGSLFYGVLFVLFSIYALLAIPFRSYLQPLMVMLVIPYSIGGAILGHMLLGMQFSFMSLLGILALSGVVINDSLVLVDFINRRRREGVPLVEAVRTAGVARFRPILLTSLTTFMGLLPLLLETSTQAQFLIPMAVSLGFGILFGTFLSLLLVPAGYVILEDFIRLLGRGEQWEEFPEQAGSGEPN